jgi:hypothetical protein
MYVRLELLVASAWVAGVLWMRALMGAEAARCIAMGGQLGLDDYGFIIIVPDSTATSIEGAAGS